MGRYQCIQPCWHNGHKYRMGEIAEFTDDFPKHGPKHKQAGQLAHFRLISGDVPAIPSAPGEVEVKVNSRTERHRQ